MKKQRKKTGGKAKATPQPASPPDAAPDRRAVLRKLRNGGIAAIALGAGGYFSVQSVRATMREYDLSRIGNGLPAVVQIHDPNCPICNALQKEARAALSGFDSDQMEYLVANIRTRDGSALARKHGVPHVTLLLFDSEGALADILQGPNDRDTLRSVFTDHLRAHGRRNGSS